MKNTFLLIAFCIWICQSFAQNNKIQSNLIISPMFGNTPLSEGQWFVSPNGDSMQFDNIRFYLSAIQLEGSDGQIYTDTVKAHLIDVFEPSTLSFPLPNGANKNIKKMRFNIGIDSITNVSGALSDDLDPTKGMYWAWQSGYINMKIEGRSPKCPTRKNAFQFHLGGYMQPFYAMRQVELPFEGINTDGTSRSSREGGLLKMDVSKFFDNIHLATQNSIMIPCKEAMQLADNSIQTFSIDVLKK